MPTLTSSFELDVRRHACASRERQRLHQPDVRQHELVARLEVGCARRRRVMRIGVDSGVGGRGRAGRRSVAQRHRRRRCRSAGAAVRREAGEARRENAEAAAGRRLRQVIDDRALSEHRLAHRRVLHDVAVEAQAALEEPAGGDIELTEHQAGLVGVARGVDDHADVFLGARRSSES